MSLKEYQKKRDFHRTAEPKAEKAKKAGFRYVIQKHAASHLHYDFRLELDGVLKSWAVPKGPSLVPGVRSLAVHVEDHPVGYATFEGTIPEGEYGGGTVMVWDEGTWEPENDAADDYARGKLAFRLHGKKLKGLWKLVRMGGKAGADGKNWLLIKSHDEHARTQDDVAIIDEMPKSAATGRTLDEIAAGKRPRQRAAATKKKAVAKRQRATPDRRVKTANFDVAALHGARRSAMPRVIQPQLATLVQEPPLGDDWLYEVKLDGYRLICRVENGNVVLRTRAGNDWTERFPHIAAAAAALPVKQAMLDGEVVVLSPQGISDFQALQNMISRQGDADLLYYAFDLPYCGGYDLTEVPLIERKALLSRLINTLPAGGPIRYSDHIQGDGQNVMAHACHSIVEGMVAKRVNSPYEQRRSDQWLKIKCTKRQEFVIGGWTDPGGARKELGALLLGYYNDAGELVYAGRVGTGYTAESLIELRRALDKVAANRPAFAVPPAGSRNAHVHWVEPKIVAEVAFQSWTSDGMVRHAAFQGLREDKPPRDVRRERERTAYSKGSTMGRELKRAPLKIASNADWPFATRLTNPDRVLYPEAGITKRELADYFAAVADWILPHVAGRPLTVVRCPGGIGEGCFFQKHLGEGMPPSLRGIEIQEEKTQGVYLVVDDVEGLIALAQIGALELHPWLCRADKIERPDRLIFDLDPGPGREWADVVDAARLVRARLEDLGLTGFPRTTGGKGMHVVVPLTRTVAWDELKLFARAFATRLERRHPDRFVTTSSKQKRQGKIYIDYLRNERGATAIASYSTRARPGAPVATPLRWDEVRKNLDPMRFNLRTLPKRLAKIAADPWAGMFELKQSLNRATVERLLA